MRATNGAWAITLAQTVATGSWATRRIAYRATDPEAIAIVNPDYDPTRADIATEIFAIIPSHFADSDGLAVAPPEDNSLSTHEEPIHPKRSSLRPAATGAAELAAD